MEKNSLATAGDVRTAGLIGKIPWRQDSLPLQYSWASLVAQMVKNLPAMQETWVPSLGWGNPPEEGMVIHSSILGEGNGNPLQYSCLENPMDRGVWQATVHKVSQS